jgi:hypothetical protein
MFDVDRLAMYFVDGARGWTRVSSFEWELIDLMAMAPTAWRYGDEKTHHVRIYNLWKALLLLPLPHRNNWFISMQIQIQEPR